MTTDITELAQLRAELSNPAIGSKDHLRKLALSLVEALEKAQKSNAFLKGQLSELANFNPDWDKLEASYESWREIAAELLVAKERIADIEPIRAAAEKLVRCKGRYHSEQNYRALAALFGVTTPDLPPLDSESSAVTVKLTDINEFLAEVHDKTLNRAFRLLAEGVRAGDVAAMRAAGIKVEAE